MSSDFETTIDDFHEDQITRDSKAIFSKLIQDDQYLGDIFSINYEHSKVLVHDFHRKKVGAFLFIVCCLKHQTYRATKN